MKKYKGIAFVLVLFLIAVISSIYTNGGDYDLWARLAVGSIYDQTASVLSRDIFSFTLSKDIWVDHEWGAGAILYFLAKHFGDKGFFILRTAVIFLIFFIIYETIKFNRKNDKIGIFFFFMAAFAELLLFFTRSQLITLLLFALWIYILERVRKGETRLLWIMPATMLFWANIHGGFVSGLGLLVLYSIGEFLNGKSPLKYLITFLVSLFVTLINPYGLEYWRFILDAVTMPRPDIEEWQPIWMVGDYMYVFKYRIPLLFGQLFFIIPTVVIGAKYLWEILLSKKKELKVDWTKVIVIMAVLYLAIKHKRFSGLFVFTSFSLLYWNFVEMGLSIKNFIDRHFSKTDRNIFFNLIKVFKVAFIIFFCIYCIFSFSPRMKINPLKQPLKSAEFLSINNIQGNLLCGYDWGSFLFWKLYPNMLVSIDGRYEEVYPESTNQEIASFYEKRQDWYEVLRKYHIDVILLEKKYWQLEDMTRLPEWRPVFEDELSVVLIPAQKVRQYVFIPSKDYTIQDFSKKLEL